MNPLDSALPFTHPCRLARRQFLGTSLVLLPWAASAGYNFWTGEYTLSRTDLQAAIERHFPLQLRYSRLFEVLLSTPVLALDASNNRISIATDVQIDNPILQPTHVQGALALSSALVFDTATSSLRLQQPRADRVELQGLSGRNAQQLQAIGSRVVQELLHDRALYTFSAEDLHRFGKTLEPGAITVMEDGVKIALR